MRTLWTTGELNGGKINECLTEKRYDQCGAVRRSSGFGRESGAWMGVAMGWEKNDGEMDSSNVLY